MKIISIHQPNFIGNIQFYNKIKQSDIFILLSRCQFEKNGYQNRFLLNEKWYTMSVNKGLEPIWHKQYVNHEKDWNRIKSSLFEYNILNEFDECISSSLTITNLGIIKKICKKLDIKTPIDFDFPTKKTGTDRLVELCKSYGATHYLSGVSGRNYLELEKFKEVGIEVIFQELKEEDKECVLKKLK